MDADTTGSGQHLNVLESKFRREVVRGECGLDVAHNQQLLPLCNGTLSPTNRLVDRGLLESAGVVHARIWVAGRVSA